MVLKLFFQNVRSAIFRSDPDSGSLFFVHKCNTSRKLTLKTANCNLPLLLPKRVRTRLVPSRYLNA